MILGGGRRYFALSELRLRELYQGKTEDEVELRLTLLLCFNSSSTNHIPSRGQRVQLFAFHFVKMGSVIPQLNPHSGLIRAIHPFFEWHAL